MKIGVLAPYLDTRKDVRDLLNLLSLDHDVVAYSRKSDAGKIGKLLPKINVIPIPEMHGISRIFQLLWQYTYLVLGMLPASKYNYYLTERIKLLNSSYKKWSKHLHSFLLLLSRATPKVVTYDQYLDSSSWLKNSVPIDGDVDIFLCFTEISDDHVFAKIIQVNKPVWTYVYSWDHPCKMKTFSKRTNYLVWNEGIKADLITLQHIEADKIHVWGATQFAFIEHFIKSEEIESENCPYHFPYIYIGCATGYDDLSRQEVKYCHQMADMLKATSPDWKLVIRPYPFQKNKNIYTSLKTLSNVIFDESFSSNDKLLRIKYARAFFHFGTTMGYEALYFDTPSFLLDIADKNTLLYEFVHQYQNDKYLNTTDSLVIKSFFELTQVFKNLGRGRSEFYSNQKIRTTTPLHSLPDLVDTLILIININNTNLLAI